MDHEVTVELKNDIQIRGTLKSVDQYLNIKLDDISVVEEIKYPHLVSRKSTNFALARQEMFNAAGKSRSAWGHVRKGTEANYCIMQSSVKNVFIRGSVVRYVHLPGNAVDTALLEDATRRGIFPTHHSRFRKKYMLI